MASELGCGFMIETEIFIEFELLIRGYKLSDANDFLWLKIGYYIL